MRLVFNSDKVGWVAIASQMAGRSDVQCRNRYLNLKKFYPDPQKFSSPSTGVNMMRWMLCKKVGRPVDSASILWDKALYPSDAPILDLLGGSSRGAQSATAPGVIPQSCAAEDRSADNAEHFFLPSSAEEATDFPSDDEGVTC
jgi:hypothetical protein